MANNLTGAPKPVTLTKKDDNGNKIGEVALEFKPLSDVDIDTLDEWIRVEFITAVRKSLRADDVTPEERREEMQIAHETAATLTWLSGRGAQLMACPKGLARLIFQHCKDCKETFADVRKMMFDPDNVLLVNEGMQDVNDSNFKSERLKKLAKEADTPGKPNRRQRRASKSSKRKGKKRKKRK